MHHIFGYDDAKVFCLSLGFIALEEVVVGGGGGGKRRNPPPLPPPFCDDTRGSGSVDGTNGQHNVAKLVTVTRYNWGAFFEEGKSKLARRNTTLGQFKMVIGYSFFGRGCFLVNFLVATILCVKITTVIL